MVAEYVPGRCNIGIKGQAIRLTTGIGIIAVFLALDFLVLSSTYPVLRLSLAIPFYVGLLAVLEGSMSFCVLHASRGTYDLHESRGLAFGHSRTRTGVGSEEWKRLDKRKARLMHLEGIVGGLVLALLLAFA